MLTNTQGWLHAAGAGHDNIVLEKAWKKNLTLAEEVSVVQWRACRFMLYLCYDIAICVGPINAKYGKSLIWNKETS